MEKVLRKEIEQEIVNAEKDNAYFAIFACGGYGPWKSFFKIGQTICAPGHCRAILIAKVRGEDNAQSASLDAFFS